METSHSILKLAQHSGNNSQHDKISTTNKQIKLGWALSVTYTIIQSIMRSEMCSLHLTHPSVHTWSSGQPSVQRLGSSRGLPVGAGIRTHNLGLPRVSSPTLFPLGQRLQCSAYVFVSYGENYGGFNLIKKQNCTVKVFHVVSNSHT